MSRLRLYAPAESEKSRETERPVILSYQAFADVRRPGRLTDLLHRARNIFFNRECPDCGRVTVVPLELRDGIRGGDLRVIPGTGTLVGFRCRSCCAEWAAEAMSEA
jgi:hypothetical protein